MPYPFCSLLPYTQPTTHTTDVMNTPTLLICLAHRLAHVPVLQSNAIAGEMISEWERRLEKMEENSQRRGRRGTEVGIQRERERKKKNSDEGHRKKDG